MKSREKRENATRRLGDPAQPFDVVGVAAIALGLGAQVVGVADDRGERVVELVHHAGRDLPEASELLGLDDLPS